MSKQTKLKVGDKIYRVSYYDNKHIKEILTIERTTKTQAISGNTKFKIEYKEGYSLDIIPYESGLKHWYYQAETEELKDKFKKQNLYERLELSIKQLQKVSLRTNNITVTALENLIKNISDIENKFIEECKK